MKILIATSMAGGWPYIPEIRNEFSRSGTHVEVFDINDYGSGGLPARIAFRIPKLRYRTTVALLKRKLTQLPADFDAVNIHFAAPIYCDLAKALKGRGKKLVTTIWGSDFLRAGSSELRDLGRTFDASDIVTSNNPAIMKRIVAQFPSISSRARIVPFGLKSLDVIARLQRVESWQDSRRRLGIPSDKIVVTCGYNAIPAQRHAMMICALAALPRAYKSKLFVLIPMTYPDDRGYRLEVRKLLQTIDVEYQILEKKLTIEDTARLRISSDYAINMQTTDSLSASIQEHIFAGSSMIVGRWLPYDIFEKMGVSLHKVETEKDISATLKALLKSPGEKTKPECADRLYDYSSWNSNVRRWLALYSGDETDSDGWDYHSWNDFGHARG